MGQRLLINKAFEDGNKKLFLQGKKTYSSLHSLSEDISLKIDVPKINVWNCLNRWAKGGNSFTKKTEIIVDAFFEIFDLESENYLAN